METTAKRLSYLDKLDEIIAQALEKYRNRYTKNTERIRWGRLAANTVKIANDLLKDSELADLIQRIERIEKELF